MDVKAGHSTRVLESTPSVFVGSRSFSEKLSRVFQRLKNFLTIIKRLLKDEKKETETSGHSGRPAL